MTERTFEDLASLSATAVPSIAETPHLGPSELAAVRASEHDDDAGLDETLRHLAACAACRARLREPQPMRATARAGGTRRAGQHWLLACAAAAGLLLAWRGVHDESRAEPVSLVQRSYVGMMGEANRAPAAPRSEDRNLELTLRGPAQAARLLFADERGAIVAPLLDLRRGAEGLRGVVAPRTFAPHQGAVHAVVVLGDAGAVAATFEHLPGPLLRRGAASLKALRGQVERAASESGARVILAVLSSE